MPKSSPARGAARKSAVKAGGGAKPCLDYGPLPDLVGYALRRAQVAVFQDFNAVFAGADIRPAQYSTLALIDRNPGSSQSAIAGALGIKRTNFVALFNTLEARGLARRAADPGDRRTHALALTPAGKALLAKLHRLAQRHEARFSAGMSKAERAELFRLLGVVRAQGEGGRNVIPGGPLGRTGTHLPRAAPWVPGRA